MTPSHRGEITALRIEEAGIELFSQMPYSSVTMDMIAKCAGLSKRAVYNHFPSKAALLISTFESRLNALHEQEKLALSGCSSAEEVLFTHIRLLNSFTRQNYRFSRVYWSLKDYIGEGHISKEMLANVIDINRRLIDLPAKYLMEMPRKGLLSEYEPELIIHYLGAVNKGIFLQYDKEAAFDIQTPSWENLSAFSLRCFQCFLEHE